MTKRQYFSNLRILLLLVVLGSSMTGCTWLTGAYEKVTGLFQKEKIADTSGENSGKTSVGSKGGVKITPLGEEKSSGPAETNTKQGKGKGKKVVQVQIKTNQGVIDIELDQEKAPVSVKNFLSYVDDKYYDNTVFHRIIDGFMIQGGGFALDASTKKIAQKETKDPIELESKNGLKNLRGTIAMARTGDPDSATSQFFINCVDNGSLDYPQPDGHGYAVFGKVTTGMEVVDKIKIAPKGTHPLVSKFQGETFEQPARDVPNDPIVIESVRRL
jgi:cyclophilin family peptidyl-prolyl cis-trans isomerase